MAILGSVKPALAHFTQGVRKALQRRRQQSWAFSDKHLPSTHHPQSKRCSHLRMEGSAQSWFPAAEEIFCVCGGVFSLPQGLGRGRPGGRARAAAGQPPGAGPSQVTSPFPPSPLPWLRAFPQCPGWGVHAGAGPAARI